MTIEEEIEAKRVELAKATAEPIDQLMASMGAAAPSGRLTTELVLLLATKVKLDAERENEVQP